MKDKEQKNSTVSISTATIFKVIAIGLAMWFLYSILNVIGILFVSLIFTAGIAPWVDWLEDKRIPRVIGTTVLYVITLSIFSLVIILIIPPVTEQIGQITSVFPEYYNRISQDVEALRESGGDNAFVTTVQEALRTVNENLGRAASGIFSSLVTIFGGLASFLSIAVITFYLMLERNGMKKIIHALAPAQYQPYLTHLGNRITLKLGSWLRGQLMLGLIIFVITYVGLLVLGVKYALVLALIAGILELIPIIGPILSAIPALFLSFAESPAKALLVLILYVVIQQLENQIVVPKVMQKSVGLNPVVVIVAMLIGAKLGGLLGIILAIPTAAIIQVFSSDFFGSQRDKDNALESESQPS
ncbi:MAG: AI-2E family transporter [bacterium]|nr:AI-2E family transporter [bacterium]